jgi:histone-lysine N-methyltransferase SETMAR
MDTKKKERSSVLNRGVVMLHYNASPHTAAATQDLNATLGWEQFDHPPYSPDLAPSDFHVFLHLKTFLGDWRFLGEKRGQKSR